MITLYRRSDCAEADDIQNALDEMVIAYETNVVPSDANLPDDVDTLPALRDEDTVVSGEQAVQTHLEELRSLMEDWNRFQSDACYINEDGSIC